MSDLPASFSNRYADSPAKCAKALGISSATFYRRIMPYVYDGTIQSVRIGACRRIVIASLLDFLNTNGVI